MQYDLTLTSPEVTDLFGATLAHHLVPGDCILLEGDIGMGKSHLARAIIRAMTHANQDVPSPTFTLLQSYDTAQGEVFHMDLYRLGDPDELAELGLDNALTDAICLIEWPKRLGGLTPVRYLKITLSDGTDADVRHADLTPQGAGWTWLADAVAAFETGAV